MTADKQRSYAFFAFAPFGVLALSVAFAVLMVALTSTSPEPSNEASFDSATQWARTEGVRTSHVVCGHSVTRIREDEQFHICLVHTSPYVYHLECSQYRCQAVPKKDIQ